MKPPSGTIVVGTILLVCAGVFLAGKHHLDHSKHLERLVVQAVTPHLKGSFTLERVRVGFFSVHLEEVRFGVPAKTASVSVNDLKISLSPIKLIGSGFRIGRSINRIEFIGPILELSTHRHETDAVFRDSAVERRQGSRITGSTIALSSLLIRKGEVRFRDAQGEVGVIADRIEGRLWDTEREMNFDLTGSLGSKERNLFASGRIALREGRHTLSLRLQRERITRPLAIDGVTLTDGILGGALEVAFADSLSLSSMDANGILTLTGGSCVAKGFEMPVDSMNVALSLNHTRCTIDSLTARYGSAQMHAAGSWDLVGSAVNDRITYSCRNIWMDSLGLRIPRNLLRGVAGAGWLRGELSRQLGGDVVLTANAGGVTIAGTPLLRLSIGITFQNRQWSFDSLALFSPACTFAGSGIIDYSTKATAYSFHGKGNLDSLSLLLPGMSGRMTINGSLRGVGEQSSGGLRLEADSLYHGTLALGSATLIARASGDSVTVALKNTGHDAGMTASAVVRRAFGTRPMLEGTFAARAKGSSPLLASLPTVDSITMAGQVHGWGGDVRFRFNAGVASSFLNGEVIATVDRDDDSAGPFICRLRRTTLCIDDRPAACNGHLRIYSDSIIVDSLVLLDRAVTRGRIITAGSGRIDAFCKYHGPLRDIFSVGSSGSFQVDGGVVDGEIRLSGRLDSIITHSEFRIRDAALGGVAGFQTDVAISSRRDRFTILPFTLRKDDLVVASLDTLSNDPRLRFSGRFEELDLRAVFGALLPEDATMQGRVTGSFRSTGEGVPVVIECSSRKIKYNNFEFDSVAAEASLDSGGLFIRRLRACDGSRTTATGNGRLSWAFLHGEADDRDTARVAIAVDGDLIATLRRNGLSAIDGEGKGSMRLAMEAIGGEWRVDEGSMKISKGILRLAPYLPEPLGPFSCDATIGEEGRLSLVLDGMAGKQSVRLSSTHLIPAGYKPLVIGPLNLGILQLETSRRGLKIHLPGFMERGEYGEIEPGGRSVFRFLTLAGPIEQPTLIGTLLLRDLEFTYPPIANVTDAEENTISQYGDKELLPAIRWEVDIRPADRKVVYFRDITGAKTRLVRFVEATVDPSSTLKIRGGSRNESLRLLGTIRSYRGIIYYGKSFNRNFEVGIEFIPQRHEKGEGYNNMPFLWGNAESMADSGRFNRIKLTALVQDPVNGTLAERGRLAEDRFNVVFHVSSDFEELPGESERQFYEQAGLQFTTLGGAGRAVSDFGEQNLHRILLQRFERRLAKSLGLDVISIETSIASNYFSMFYNNNDRQNGHLLADADFLALANAGLTVGRYFSDNLFIKARGGFLPVDTALTPEYSVGFEYQPVRYLFIEGDYGFYKEGVAIEHNPRVNLQLRLPIANLRNYLDF